MIRSLSFELWCQEVTGGREQEDEEARTRTDACRRMPNRSGLFQRGVALSSPLLITDFGFVVLFRSPRHQRSHWTRFCRFPARKDPLGGPSQDPLFQLLLRTPFLEWPE